MKSAGASPAFRYSLAAVGFLLFLGWLASGVEQVGIASQFVDPVSRIPSQDEAVYAHEAIAIARLLHLGKQKVEHDEIDVLNFVGAALDELAR